MNIQQTLRQAIDKLSETSPTPGLDAQILLCHILHCNSAHLAAWPEEEIAAVHRERFDQLTSKRVQGHPIAHLTGSREFWSLEFLVDQNTLIPRPDTETLIEYILDRYSDRHHLKLLDMGTGTGAIAISLASEKPSWEIHASDISKDALDIARSNNERLHTDVSFIHSNWFNKIEQTDFNIIVSNPPYIAEQDLHLDQGDVRFEPRTALVSGATGMDDIEHLCQNAGSCLAPDGQLIVEHGFDQGDLCHDCFDRHGYRDIEQVTDLNGHIRMTAGTVSGK